MKKLLTFSILLLTTLSLFAQPINDDCSGIIDLGTAPFCDDSMIFINVGATESDIGNDNFPDCWTGDPERDVWFQFTAVDTILDYTISVIGCPDPLSGAQPITNPQIAIYRGDICAVDELVLLDCEPDPAMPGANEVELNPPALTPGITYYLRINDWSSTGVPNSGGFKLCIDKQDVLVTIDEGGSTECSGQLADSGGLDEDYGNNENHTFTICPDQPHNCINFTMEYFHIENINDQILFFDGPNTNGTPIAALDGSGFNLNTNGGVCFQTFASSGCMTIQFQSDGASTFEGFSGFWECTSDPCEAPEPITVNTNITDQTIIDNIATPQTTVTITDINCADGAIGTFTADNSDLGLEKGLVITSGAALGAAGLGTSFTSIANAIPGDPDLDYLSTTTGNGSPSNDACIIELDVFVATDELTFEYVFGSEEYPEFVNSNFNDIFAFLVSGPGIIGDPNIGNQKNISVLPDGNNTFIQINSVNSDLNWEYYRNNENGLSIAYDGLTSDFNGTKKSLTARTFVEPCNTYHLKIAVADRQDQIFDSGVFMSEVKGGTPSISVNYFSGIEYLVEECTLVPDEIVISIGQPKEDTVTYALSIGGTATPGVDYDAPFLTSLTFPPGVTEVSFPIQALPDGITEGVETIILQLENDFGCGVVDLANLTIELHDNVLVEIFAGSDTAFVCQGGSIAMEVDGAQQYAWSPPIIFDDPNISDPVATPTQSQYVEVVGTLGVCQDRDSVWLEITDPQIDIEVINGSLELCEGDEVTLLAVNNVDNANIQWTPTDGILGDPNLPIITASPAPGTTTYTAQVSLNGCGAQASVEVLVDDFDFPNLTTTDTLICQNFSVTLADPMPGTTTTFEWSPPFWIDDPTLPNATVTPDISTTYTVVATSESEICMDSASVNIEVVPADVNISNPDTIEICLGEVAILESITSTGGVGLKWFPSDSLSSTTDEIVGANPSQTTTYYAELVVGACTVIDSVVVVVDSLPELSIFADPDKESYCEGEQITLFSETYEPAHFPNMEFFWDVGPGMLTPDTFLNLVINALDTFTYVRGTVNRGCESVDTIEIIVIPTTAMEIIPADTVICPGETIQFSVTGQENLDGIEWMGNGLSCTDCFDPTVTLPSSGNYSFSAEGDFEGCPVNASASIEVQISPVFNFPNDKTICQGDAIELNNPPDPTSTFTWTLEDGTLVSNEANPTVSPSQTTTYLVSANNGCEAQEEVTIIVIEPLVLTITEETTICDGDDVTLTISPEAQGLNYVWTANGEPIGDNSNTLTDSPSEQTVYEVAVDDGGECGFTQLLQTTVNVDPFIVIDSFQIFKNGELLQRDTVYEGEIIDVTVFTTPPHDLLDNPSYEWFFNNVLERTTQVNMSGDIVMPEVEVDQSFNILVNILENTGCFDRDSRDITLLDDPVQIPNAFTPDGDGHNDAFNILFPDDLTPVLEKFAVYNRWGQQVYNNENGLAGWNGMQNGKPAASDVYVYHIVYRLSEISKTVEESGEVTLLR